MNTITMKKDLFNKYFLKKDTMYKTLENPQALKDYMQIRYEINRMKEKHNASMQKSYSVTWFFIQEIFGSLANANPFQKLRSNKR